MKFKITDTFEAGDPPKKKVTPSPAAKESKLQEKLDEIFDKHTIMLTKRNGVVSFDEVIVNIYKVKNAILDYLESRD